ncbi:class I SAM-dependent methyltransferase [Patescibacteria group bacterium]|nr:MAG: class I SAM-dependent methyltransferase [Patescibacteria group bacterium]
MKDSQTHFDTIDYDKEIPLHMRLYYAEKKVGLMLERLKDLGFYNKTARILDVGCGTGEHLKALSGYGFQNVYGLDLSGNLVRSARAKNPSIANQILQGDILAPPFPDKFDVVFTITMLHHLASVADQEKALENMIGLAKPGGIIFVHEMSIRNPLFSFYLKHIFRKRIHLDTGKEIFIRDSFFSNTKSAKLIDIRYFTFIPDFTPQIILRPLAVIESWLEQTPLTAWGAHYLVTLQRNEKNN